MAKIELRESVQRFAEAMELKLRTHDKDRGKTGWLDIKDEDVIEDVFSLRSRIDQVIEEETHIDHEKALEEIVDVANFAMMYYDVLLRDQKEDKNETIKDESTNK